MTGAEYWASLDFEYLIAYSLFRGEHLEAYLNKVEQEIAVMKELQNRSRWHQGIKLGEEICRLEKEKQIYNVTILDADFNLHGSAREIIRFGATDEGTNSLGNILSLPYQSGAVSACVPVYRHAIIFYGGQGQIISSLNICFECWKMAINASKTDIYVYGESVYPALSELFGHWENIMSNIH